MLREMPGEKRFNRLYYETDVELKQMLWNLEPQDQAIPWVPQLLMKEFSFPRLIGCSWTSQLNPPIACLFL